MGVQFCGFRSASQKERTCVTKACGFDFLAYREFMCCDCLFLRVFSFPPLRISPLQLLELVSHHAKRCWHSPPVVLYSLRLGEGWMARLVVVCSLASLLPSRTEAAAVGFVASRVHPGEMGVVGCLFGSLPDQPQQGRFQTSWNRACVPAVI